MRRRDSAVGISGLLKLAVRTFIAKGVSASGSIILTLILARELGASGLGAFMLALSIIVGLGVFSRLGLDTAALRFGGVAVAEGNRSSFLQLRRAACRIILPASAALGIGLGVFSNFLAKYVFDAPETSLALIIFGVSLVPYSAVFLQGTWIKALRYPEVAPFFEIGAVSLLTAVIIWVVRLTGYAESSVTMAAASFCIACWIVATAGFMFVRAAIESSFPNTTTNSQSSEKEMVSSLPDYFAIALTAYLVQWSALLIVGLFEDSDSLGIFGAATRLAFLVNFILVVFNSIYAPRFAEAYQGGDMERLRSDATRSTVFMIAFAVPIVLTLVVAPTLILNLFGPEFTDGASILIILALGQFVNVATGSVGLLLNMTGHQREMRNVTLIAGLVTVASSLALIPIMGILGAAVANALALIVQNMIAAHLVSKHLGIEMLPTLSGGCGRRN